MPRPRLSFEQRRSDFLARVKDREEKDRLRRRAGRRKARDAQFEADCLRLDRLTADPFCVKCAGDGVPIANRFEPTVCRCVWRGIFRTCFRRRREIRDAQVDGRTSVVRSWPGSFGRPRENFAASFDLICRRVGGDLFRLWFERGLDSNRATLRLGLDRGRFFHAAYDAEVRMGRALRAEGLFAEIKGD